ncbi:hypothetical protein FNV43_RR02176 [Rhamnella rubrinervis]|uniref:Uncharacterized protein n=1 Tax=Rhamnella rubrinervis TaxID=2594499 RepID=A0A8K0HSQ2_9ROSA|nr:hypothetical protein FNV43_RR02176 [Rhamnella rubrinervis]
MSLSLIKLLKFPIIDAWVEPVRWTVLKSKMVRNFKLSYCSRGRSGNFVIAKTQKRLPISCGIEESVLLYSTMVSKSVRDEKLKVWSVPFRLLLVRLLSVMLPNLLQTIPTESIEVVAATLFDVMRIIMMKAASMRREELDNQGCHSTSGGL